jgi:hypothetical protein
LSPLTNEPDRLAELRRGKARKSAKQLVRQNVSISVLPEIGITASPVPSSIGAVRICGSALITESTRAAPFSDFDQFVELSNPD